MLHYRKSNEFTCTGGGDREMKTGLELFIKGILLVPATGGADVVKKRVARYRTDVGPALSPISKQLRVLAVRGRAGVELGPPGKVRRSLLKLSRKQIDKVVTNVAARRSLRDKRGRVYSYVSINVIIHKPVSLWTTVAVNLMN
ncbi:hypothetical protein EVAR_26003_1 [Eumeta japonica]|uniref:Uncharacterized protein n=1 Tax=Eumeta variegata TaxID=151549 RepID=A0A4C1V310_EUMVA|nr:hypothetical protein EVAR_26003_1 [Eumeta japonica]